MAVAAAAMALIAIYVGLRPGLGFADVAANVFRQPWIHVRTAATGKDVSQATEGWYSSEKQIGALISPTSIQFHDYRVQLHYAFDPRETTLYRMPEFESREANNIESMIAVLAAIARDERAPEKPLDSLPLFGNGRNNTTVISQQLEKVMEQGQAWLDYRLTVSMPEHPDPIEMLFRVDVGTKLLRLCRMTGRDKGEPATREMHFDYPQTGPADIYALGVPRSAPLVDRVPAGDLKRIVESLRAGRERMDNYRAIFVNILEGMEYEWWREALPIVFYRKGDRFRADYPVALDALRGERPGPDVDMHRWWEDRLAAFGFYPQTVVRGPTTYRSQMEYVNDPDGTRHADLIAVKDYKTGGEWFPAEWSMMPEFGCRAVGGISGQDFEPEIDLHPTEGPAGCIMLSVWRKSSGGKAGNAPPGWRYWLDPARDYIVMRYDMEGPAKVNLIEETARSPHGIWYATKIRRKDAGTTSDGKPFDQVYHLYVDFDADLPDTLFDPPRPGRIH